MIASDEIEDDDTRRAVLLALRYLAQAELVAPGARDPRVVDEIDADELWPDAFVGMALIAAELLAVATCRTTTTQAHALRRVGNILIGTEAHIAVPDSMLVAPATPACATTTSFPDCRRLPTARPRPPRP